MFKSTIHHREAYPIGFTPPVYRYCGLFLVILMMACMSSPVFAQSGAIQGTIVDRQTGDPLPGATVLIDGTSIGASTSLDGKYRIDRTPAGEHTLIVRYLGYQTERVPVSVGPGETLTIDTALDPEVIQGEEIVITGQAEGQVAAINQQLSSNTIVNVVSAARIQELPDANAAESVGRLPGISIQRNAGEGQKVIVRGLSPKYSSVTVNGERVPATDLQDRSVDLTMIAPDMLAGIEVFKVLTPDKDADAIGGIVNFTFRGAPADFHYNLTLQSGYSSQESMIGHYKGSATLSNRFFGQRLGILATANLERADRSSDVFSAGYYVKREAIEGETRAPIGIDGVALTDRLETRDRYGASIVLDYELPNGRIMLNNVASRLDRDELMRNKNYSLSSFRTRYDLHDRDINVSILSNSIHGEHNIRGVTFDWRLSRSLSLQKLPYHHRIRFHELAAFNDAILEDEKGPSFIPPAAKNTLTNTFLYDGRFFQERAREEDLNAQMDLKIPVSLSRQIAGYIQLGGKFRSKSRSRDEDQHIRRFDLGGNQSPSIVFQTYPERQFELSPNGYITINNFLDQDYDDGSFLDGQYEINVALDRAMFADFYEKIGSSYLRSIFADLGDYNFGEDVGSGYVMAEMNITPRLMILPGIRYEYTWTEFDAKYGVESGLGEEQGIVNDTSASNEYGLWFPMLHVRYRLTDWFDIRLARTRTLSRPEYMFLSPARRVSADARLVERGNPSLKPVKATNYDAFLSFHTNRLGLFTIGGFYKELDDLVYSREKTVLNPEEEKVPPLARGFALHEPVNNSSTTKVRGIEVEWQTHFNYLPKPFDGLVLNANYARIHSETQYPRVILRRQSEPPYRFVQVDTIRVGRMPNQADDIVNISLGYDKGGFSGRISMLYQGNSLSSVGDRPEVDGFTDAYIRWDASLMQDITGGLSLFLNLNNLGNRPDVSYQATAGFPTALEYYGWSMDLGARFRF